MSFIPDDHVCLLLLETKSGNGREEWCYLDIPLDTIDNLCSSPLKYLVYLAWCILGLDTEYESLSLGICEEDGNFRDMGNDEDLESGGVYGLLDVPQSKYSSVVPHERAVLIHGRLGCSRP